MNNTSEESECQIQTYLRSQLFSPHLLATLTALTQTGYQRDPIGSTKMPNHHTFCLEMYLECLDDVPHSNILQNHTFQFFSFFTFTYLTLGMRPFEQEEILEIAKPSSSPHRHHHRAWGEIFFKVQTQTHKIFQLKPIAQHRIETKSKSTEPRRSQTKANEHRCKNNENIEPQKSSRSSRAANKKDSAT